jgi:hypothetical protein
MQRLGFMDFTTEFLGECSQLDHLEERPIIPYHTHSHPQHQSSHNDRGSGLGPQGSQNGRIVARPSFQTSNV